MEEESKSKSEGVENLKKINYEEELECAVCLQSCVHPVRLPCSHIFCFLCVKGAANQSKRCAMCRQEIPADFLENPYLLNKVEEKEYDLEGYQWFYEGRNGWWQYDERTSKDLEGAYSRGDRVFEILVAGFLYTVDFDRMVQQRRNDPSRRRRIKRDLASIPKKGVAGLKTVINQSAVEEQSINVTPSTEDNLPSSSASSNVHDENSESHEDVEASSDYVESSSTSRSVSNLEASLRLSSEYQVLEYLHLLHSDLQQRNSPVNRIPETSRTSWTSELSVNGTANPRRTRAHSTSLRGSGDSQSPTELRENLRTRFYSDPPSPSQPLTLTSSNIESSDLEDPVAAITDHIENLAIDCNDTEVQYYSLDDTVEYNLPNNNEDL